MARNETPLPQAELLNDRDNLLTVQEVAGILRVKEFTVREWLRKSTLPGYRLPSGWRVKAGDLTDFLEKHRR
ncbi:MAG: helix-turn-helix domain-containing protein [Actinobacteria bacterium]|nr:helix-turn-helix domain-containing protein [Actinomycetota bacterium]